MPRPGTFFRAGIGAVITDGKKRVLACERYKIRGAWQMPQGGIEEGEEPLDAAYREVEEETAITRERLELVHSCPEPLAYELPPQYRTRRIGRGQVQYWFLFRLVGGDGVINLGENGEFRDWQWMTMPDLIASAVPFRVPLYRRIAECVRDHL